MATSAMMRIFQPTFQKTHEWLDQVEHLVDLDDERQAYSLTRATLHALRDRLTVDEAMDLASQLPLLLKGVYYDGWKPSATPKPARTREAFFEEIRREMPDNFDLHLEAGVFAVFGVIGEHATQGQIEHVQNMLPEEVRDLWPD